MNKNSVVLWQGSGAVAGDFQVATVPHWLIATSSSAGSVEPLRTAHGWGTGRHSWALGKCHSTCGTVGMGWAQPGVPCHQILAVESSLARDAGGRARGWLVLPGRARPGDGRAWATEMTLERAEKAQTEVTVGLPENTGQTKFTE